MKQRENEMNDENAGCEDVDRLWGSAVRAEKNGRWRCHYRGVVGGGHGYVSCGNHEGKAQ